MPILAEPADTFAIAIRSRIDTLMRDKMFERSSVGIYVYDLTADSALYDHNSRQTLRPASNMKIMTACTALSSLGTDYTLRTRLYMSAVEQLKPAGATEDELLDNGIEFMPPACDPAEMAVIEDSISTIAIAERQRTGASAQIIIKGGMDPLLGPDDLKAFAQALKDQGISVIKSDIICDATFKDTITLGWGWCWDDNAIPLTPFLYLGEAGKFEAAFRAAMTKAGITFTGRFVHGDVPEGAKLIATRSHNIDQILQTMMKKSNNLFAESLFYHIGAKSGKPNVTRKDAAEGVAKLIRTVGHDPANYNIADGSGLSLYNYLSAELLVDVLRYVYRNEELYNHLNTSLPIMGRDGTLAKRCVGKPAQDRVHAKTGTLTGVSSLSGYALAPNGHMLAFSIINQGVMTASIGRGFQDRVCCALTRPVTTLSVEPDPLPSEDDNTDEEASPNTQAVQPEPSETNI